MGHSMFEYAIGSPLEPISIRKMNVPYYDETSDKNGTQQRQKYGVWISNIQRKSQI